MCDAGLLTNLRFAARLPPETVADLARISTVKTFAAKKVLFREGAISNELFLVQSGHVALDMHVPGRGAVRILSVGEGELLGWSALLGEGPMTATATAIENTVVVAIEGAKLRELCARNHEAGFQVMRQVVAALSQRLLATRLQLLDLFAVNP